MVSEQEVELHVTSNEVHARGQGAAAGLASYVERLGEEGVVVARGGTL